MKMNIKNNQKSKLSKNPKIVKFQWTIISIFVILIILLVYQNIHLKINCKQKETVFPENNSLLFIGDLNKRHLFKKFPMDFNLKDFYFWEKYQRDYVNNYLIMLFDFTVCGRCLHDELGILKHLKEEIEQKNIYILAIIGIVGKKEESEIIGLHNAGHIFFPFKTVTVDLLYDTFGLTRERFLDTPFYIYTSHDLKVMSIFKSQYLDTKEFEKWLQILTNQDIF